MKKLNLNIATAKKILFLNISFLLFTYIFLCLCSTSSFLLFAQKKGAKKRAADFDAEYFLP